MDNTNFILGINSIPKLGNKNTDVAGWTTQLDTWFLLGGISEEKNKVLWCKTTAVGDALDLIKNVCEEKPDVTMNEIKGELEVYYGSRKTQQSIMEELSMLTINRNESVKEFNLKYKKLINKLPSDKRKNFNVYDYIKALKGRRRVWEGLIINDCQNLSEAYEKAERYDKLEENPYRIPSYPNNGRPNVSAAINKDDKQCYNCGNWGHIKRFCPYYRNTIRPYSKMYFPIQKDDYQQVNDFQPKSDGITQNNLKSYYTQLQPQERRDEPVIDEGTPNAIHLN